MKKITSEMTLKDLGYHSNLEEHREEHNLSSFNIGRVISEHKERYVVKTETGEFDAELVGGLRFSAQSRTDFPAVGDWVAISEYDEGKALVHAVYPRYSSIERKAVGKFAERQIIATNIDYGLIVQAVDRDFNLNRIERYLTICHSSKVVPIIILTKTDLISSQALKVILEKINERMPQIKVFTVTSEKPDGYQALIEEVEVGKTYCLLGSSGVGKSTLLNHLAGQHKMDTGAIGEQSNRGRHVTSHRELVVLDSGGILIDNPGMREVGIADAAEGLEMTFSEIATLAESCKFKDCTHNIEVGCAVLDALESGALDADTYDNFIKMQKEAQHFDTSKVQKRKKDKAMGKLIKRFKTDRKERKF